ncbi:MAG: AMP-binding protein, partial [bacterium]|nr:AMP-binding protein [bacterium]
RVSVEHTKRLLETIGKDKIIHVYGPTESTVYATYYQVNEIAENMYTIPIGKPLTGTTLYVMDKAERLAPVGVFGELYIGGRGIARGYLNNPELTAEKFDKDFKDWQDGQDLKKEKKEPSALSASPAVQSVIYKTGDLVRWLPGGDIEFSGRIDHQVKIRGFRIELGEIESQLLNHPAVKEAAVLSREDNSGDKYLCAYIVAEKEEEFSASGLRKYLSGDLPDYMIPSYFMSLDHIPLTSQGKSDRKALPSPSITAATEYAAPRNPLEEQLASIWLEVLNPGADPLEHPVGIDDNFFELGGHSLKAAAFVARIYKTLDIEIPLAEVFRCPTLRELSGYITQQAPGQKAFLAVEPAEEKEYYILSSSQERLYTLQTLHPYSTFYNMTDTLQVYRHLEKEKLEEIFKQIIQRHESLRTSFETLHDVPVQRVHPDVPFTLQQVCLKENGNPGGSQMSDIIAQVVRPFDLARAPLVRACLITGENENDHTLIVDMHHIISDEASHKVLAREFLALCDGKTPVLTGSPVQYKDYVHWQSGEAWQLKWARQEKFWLSQFPGDPPVLELPTDYPRPLEKNFEGNTVMFEFSQWETRRLKQMAKENGSTLFTISFSIFALLLSRLSGQQDIVIGVPVSLRRHPDLEQVIGIFINTLPVRLEISASQTLPDYVSQVNQKWLRALENQDYPLERLVAKVSPKRDTSREPLFDVILNFLTAVENSDSDSDGGEDVQPLPHHDPDPVSNQPYSHHKGTAKSDFSADVFETRGRLCFSFEYTTQLFKPPTIEGFLELLKQIVSSILRQPGIKLDQIDISHQYTELTEGIFDDGLGDF